MRGPYIFERFPDKADVEGDACTIDGAIALACKISKRDCIGVTVVDRSERPNRPRGVAVGGVWQWAKSCKMCGGDGTLPSYMCAVTCAVCSGLGWLPDSGAY